MTLFQYKCWKVCKVALCGAVGFRMGKTGSPDVMAGDGYKCGFEYSTRTW